MKNSPALLWIARILLLAATASLPGSLHAVDPAPAAIQRSPIYLKVIDDKGSPIPNYRWQLEEDNTTLTIPNTPTNNSVSLVVHKSHAPVIANGSNTPPTAVLAATPGEVLLKVATNAVPQSPVPPGTPVLSSTPVYAWPGLTHMADPEVKRYLLTVMSSGYSVGGANVWNTNGDGGTHVTVILNSNPIPTAQISVLVFHDNNPINNEPDEEVGLAGFRILLSDQLGGPIKQDAFANPIGTTYWLDDSGNFILDADGQPTPKDIGSGFIYTDKDGKANIKNLWMGKIGVQAVPPVGQNWTGGHGSIRHPGPADEGAYHQTATIEGTPGVDVWGAPNEPRVFIEGFGSGNYHAFFGFVDPNQLPGLPKPINSRGRAVPPVNGGNVLDVKGALHYQHFGRPPFVAAIQDGPPVVDGWIALNEITATGGSGRGLYATSVNPIDGTFIIKDVVPGTYELVSWDKPLDGIWNFINITVPNPADAASAPQITTVAGRKTYDVNSILVGRWFGTLQGKIFVDDGAGDPTKAGNGHQDAGETEGIPQMGINVRFRDGTTYQSTITDPDGNYALTEVFPFFKWLVVEVDNTRFKPTGLTTVVDEGGLIPTDPNNPASKYTDGARTPQAQYGTKRDGTQDLTNPLNNFGDNFTRTQVSGGPDEPAITQAMQLYLGQNNRIDWGKAPYAPGENGGVGGIVSYGNTRAEADPRYSFQELWDPGVPRVQVALYEFEPRYAELADAAKAGKTMLNGLPADINFWKIKIQRPNATTPRLADVDNYPFDWSNGGARGPEDVDQDDPYHTLFDDTHVFNPGDALQITHTDSWDDEVASNPNGEWPEGVQQAQPPVLVLRDSNGTPLTGVDPKPIIGSDNFATWNQVRPGVFDGAYTMGTYYKGGMFAHYDPAHPDVNKTPIAPGDYVVNCSPPPGYYIQTEESRNIVFGDGYIPSKLSLPPECIGDFHLVSPNLSLFPDAMSPSDYANQWRPLADRKQITIIEGRNFGCDFSVYTEVPKGTRVVGFVLNDLSAEFNPTNPTYGEKESPGWIPISFRDWEGHEIARVYGDEYGCYTAMLPSTYNAAVPCPSGYSPQMITLILNDPTMVDPTNPTGPRIPDPNYNPGFTTTPWTLEYYPGSVQYADTPILPTGGFVGAPNATLDIEPADMSPVIKSVEGTSVDGYAGPWIAGPDETITITSRGTVGVPDPNYRLYGNPNKIIRDFGFGPDIGTRRVTLNGSELVIESWSNGQIKAHLPTGFAAAAFSDSANPHQGQYAEWQLMVTRGDNSVTSQIGVTLTYQPDDGHTHVHIVKPVDPATVDYSGATTPPTPIQDMIDDNATSNGDLVIVPVSTWDWNENPIMWKPLRLQGSGFGTFISANPNPAQRLHAWHAKINDLLGGDPFSANEAPGIKVFSQADVQSGLVETDPSETEFGQSPSRIDGFVIRGALQGGGISVWTKATNLRISNNRITGNQGAFAGGISLGMKDNVDITYDNQGVVIEYNQIVKNASISGGGGISIFTGGNGYKIRNNYIMGNFATSDPGGIAGVGVGAGGGGIAHEGLSPGGLIANNVIAYNEVYFGYGAGGGDGGGIYITGEFTGGTGLGTGSGSVTIIDNLIQGNLAAAGYGGGIRLAGVNGVDVQASGDSAQWHHVKIYNNIIVNNAAGYSGGGISMSDSVNVEIVGNTIADNDSTATAHVAFPTTNPNVSRPQGAGIVSELNSSDLNGVLPSGAANFSKPTLLVDNIIWHNRSFYFDFTKVVPPAAPDAPMNVVPNLDSGGLLPTATIPDPSDPTKQIPNPGYPVYRDISIVGMTDTAAVSAMGAANSVLSQDGIVPFRSLFVNSLKTAVVPDEGGNNISLRFEPIGILAADGTPRGDYHLGQPIGGGVFPVGLTEVAKDYDGNTRDPSAPSYDSSGRTGSPAVGAVDVGADQFTATGSTGIVPPVADLSLAVAFPPDQTPDLNLVPDATTPPGPLIPPGPQVAPTLNNPIYMAAVNVTDPYLVEADIISFTSFALRLQAQADPTLTLAAQADPVATLLYAGLTSNTRNLLAAYTGGEDSVLLTRLAAWDPVPNNRGELNKLIAGPSLYAQLQAAVTQGTYVPSARTLAVAATAPINLPLLNRLVIQDGFTEIRRLYDPHITYKHLAAGDGFATMADGTELYTFGFSDQTALADQPHSAILEAGLLDANAAAPTLVVKEGDEFLLDLSNVSMAMRPDLFDPHTVHFHGFPEAAPIFDGMPMASVGIHEGATLRYYYKLKDPGTYFYHCHVEATEHMQQGMIGNLWVTPAQNDATPGTLFGSHTHAKGDKYAYNDGDASTFYDKELPLQMTGFDHYFHDEEIAIQPPAFASLFDTYPLLNGRGYPDTTVEGDLPANSAGKFSQHVTSTLTAKKGDRVLLRISNVSETDFNTLSVQGIAMNVIAKDARLLRGPAGPGHPVGRNLYYNTTSVTLGGGETIDVILDTKDVTPGDYYIYSTRLNQLSNDAEDYGGLMTKIVIQ